MGDGCGVPGVLLVQGYGLVLQRERRCWGAHGVAESCTQGCPVQLKVLSGRLGLGCSLVSHEICKAFRMGFL